MNLTQSIIKYIFSKLRIGTETGYTEIDNTKGANPRLRGTATVWRDMVGDLFGKALLSTTGKVDYNFDENYIVFQSGGSITNANDRTGGNIQINHEYKIGTNIVFKPHIHWKQSDTVARVLTMRYRLQRNGEAWTSSWTTVTLTLGGASDVFPYTSGTINQISHFPDMVLTCGVSDTIQMQVARTDALAGDLNVTFMDIHGEVDAMGSDDEIYKLE